MSQIWILGGGLIGCGWAIAFGAAGFETVVIDPDVEATKQRLAKSWSDAVPGLRTLGHDVSERPSFVDVIAEAPTGTAPLLVQECLPEDLTLKRSALATLEEQLAEATVIASSTSGLSPDDLQLGMKNPGRLLIAHPCNPPWLMPVVELSGGEATSPDTLDRAEKIYVSLGKTVLRLTRPMPGHLVNRLQAAIWREAVFLMREGVASLNDIERAVTEGLAPRWCVVGPSTVFHLSGAENGMTRFLEALGPEVERWWSTLGDPKLDPETRRILISEMAKADPRPVATISAERDRRLPALLHYLQNQPSGVAG